MTQANLIERMATDLVSSECDLGDETACLRVLLKSKYAESEIASHFDEAVEEARTIKQREVVGHG